MATISLTPNSSGEMSEQIKSHRHRWRIVKQQKHIRGAVLYLQEGKVAVEESQGRVGFACIMHDFLFPHHAL